MQLKKAKKTGKIISFRDLTNTKAKLRNREKNLKRLIENILTKHGKANLKIFMNFYENC